MRILDNKRVELLHENNTNSLWVNKNLDFYNIEFKYYKDDIVLEARNIELYKTLFLKSGEVFRTELEIPNLFLKTYDKVLVRLI